tara:strand:+ start:578 stop:817 length:240 start_codon:yes stop_codon:yes gene_type:complete
MNEIINEVYLELKNRIIHPSGTFGKGNKWKATNSDLISVRSPSWKWPYSELHACRTKKYVKKCVEKFNCTTKEDLLNVI